MTQDDSQDSLTGMEIAVIGMAGRFPGAPDVDTFWENLKSGVESISFFTDEELLEAGISPEMLAEPNYVKARAIVEDVDRFDAGFFGYSPREASLLDPQQRLFLETAWSALESSGHVPSKYDGRIGVYAGSGFNHYFLRHVLGSHLNSTAEPDFQSVLANDKDFLTTRVSYKLDLEGPSVVVQTACSTSLVAVHLACQALISGECDMALAGGVTIRLPQRTGYLYQEEGAHSPDGHCRAFDEQARGCVPGSGVGVVVLKSLSAALDEGDFIHAVVKGTAINNDGATKVGYTAPRVDGQADVIHAALLVAGTPAESIGYVEAHGTGTILGDPIELAALTEAFRENTKRKQFCALGSVKSNLGHLDTAAGITGFIKTVLCVRDGLIPPSLHFHEANPKIDFAASPFYVNTRLQTWTSSKDAPRRAGLSAFGIGGTNAHAVIEEPPFRKPPPSRAGPELLVLSAKTETVLAAAKRNLSMYLEQHRDLSLSDVAWTLQQGRNSFAHRQAFVCRDNDAAVKALRDETRGGESPSREARVSFLFPGQGTQYPNMTRDLYRHDAAFAEDIDRAASILETELGLDLREVIYAEKGVPGESRLNDTRFAQPAIFAVSYALARMWMRFGVEPVAMLGHSIGEYAAACIAGLWSFPDALSLVAARGRMMAELPLGAMLAVPLDEGGVAELLADDNLALAALNSPQTCVVSGTVEAIDRLQRELLERHVETKRLRTSHAFHSPMMDPILEAFEAEVGKRAMSEPQIPFVSNLTGTWIRPEEACDPSYWSRHLRQTVRFSLGLQTIVQESPLLLEVGPGRSLSANARRHRGLDVAPRVWSSTRHPDQEQDDETTVLEALGGLWSCGVNPNWAVVGAEKSRRLVPLPTYPFERSRFWIDAQTQAIPAPSEEAAAGGPARLDFDDWFTVPSWQRLPARKARGRARHGASTEVWLVLADPHGIGDALGDELEARGEDVIRVSMGKCFSRMDERSFELDPKAPEDYRELFRALGESELARVVHCFSVEPDSALSRGLDALESNQDKSFYSVLFLVQAMNERASQKSCLLTIMTTQVHSMTGSETVCAEKATAVGLCRNIAIEYPLFDVRQLDIVVSRGDELPDGLMDTVLDPPAARIVALRGSHCWEQTFVPVRLESGSDTGLREKGIYLITGGLGGVGMAVAESLARSVRARLVLTSRREFPARAEWDAILASCAVDFAEDSAYLVQRDAEIRSRSQLTPMSVVEGLQEQLDALCCAHVLSFLERQRIVPGPSTWDVEELVAKLHVDAKLRRYFDMMLRVVCEDGFAALSGGRLRVLARDWPDVERLDKSFVERYPDFRAICELLRHCATQWESVLTGKAPALGVLYGEEGRVVFDAAIETVEEHSRVGEYRLLVEKLMERLARRERKTTLRILEVGGGEGRLTRSLLPILKDEDVEYHFTDVGTSFVVNARKRFESDGFDFLRYGVLDISRSPRGQGYALGSFDLVLGFNVVHATKDVRETTSHLRELLAPGGSMVLLESVTPQRWVDFVWGLTDGWWAFDDDRRSSPLLDLDEWENVMARAGFEQVAVYPNDPDARRLTDSGVILAVAGSDAPVAFGPESTTRMQIRKLKEIESLGAEVEIFTADVSDRARMRDVLTQAVSKYGGLHGIIHSALVLNDSAMQWKTREIVESVFAPKVRGTLVLKELAEEIGLDLDLFVLFSSLVSVLGGGGQADYCAASNFQDAFAQSGGDGVARRVVAIDWGAWREVGLAAQSAIERGATPENILLDGMTTAEGLEAFARVLGCAMPQVLVSPRKLEEFQEIRGVASAASRPSSSAESGVTGTGDVDEEHEGAEKLLVELWRELLGVDSVGVHDNFFELGGDSVISMQFIARAKQAGYQFTNAQIFERQTIAALAALVSETKTER